MVAPICSAVLALPATLMPSIRIPSIITSMPKVTTEPGSTLAIQSNNAKGTKGNPANLSTKYNSAVSGAVNNTPASKPDPKPTRRSFPIELVIVVSGPLSSSLPSQESEQDD